MTTDERDTTLDEMLGSGPDPATDPALPDAVDTEGSEDDLDFEVDLDTGAPRRRNGLVSSVLAAGILLVVAFTGGVLVQKHHDAGASTASLPAFSGATLPDFGSSGFTGGGSSPGSGSAPAVIGTVVSVEGSRIIVRDFSGTKHVVATNEYFDLDHPLDRDPTFEAHRWNPGGRDGHQRRGRDHVRHCRDRALTREEIDANETNDRALDRGSGYRLPPS